MELADAGAERDAIHAACLREAAAESGLSVELLARLVQVARRVSTSSVTTVGAVGLQEFVAAAQLEREAAR